MHNFMPCVWIFLTQSSQNLWKELLLGIYISDPIQHKSQDNITKLIANTVFFIHPLTDEICYSLLMVFTNEMFPQYNQNYTFK